jgi:hypothetical protein
VAKLFDNRFNEGKGTRLTGGNAPTKCRFIFYGESKRDWQVTETGGFSGVVHHCGAGDSGEWCGFQGPIAGKPAPTGDRILPIGTRFMWERA